MEAQSQLPVNQDPASDHLKDRRGRRILLSCRLFFFGEDDFEGEALLLDISASGCRASSSISLETGMIVRLSLFLSDHQWPLRINQAIVRWLDGKEFGLEFIDITMAQRERLRTLVMKAR
ncbi:MAG: PilZ domain-containing protein [Nitrospira sp.]|nr:MAG: PilZ domain-containing protein [Nitrospira sp.]